MLGIVVQAIAEVNLSELVKDTRSAVVTVITYDRDNKPSSIGSGFFVDKTGHIITNYHVLEDAYSAEVRTYKGKKFPIMFVVAENKAADLVKVLVDIPGGSPNWLKFVKSLPSIGERIFVIGSPMGLEQTVSEGIVSAVREWKKVGKIIQISAPISSGSSGGPVFNMKGQVVGVTTLYFKEGQNLNFAVPSQYLAELKQETASRTISEWKSEKLRLSIVARDGNFIKYANGIVLDTNTGFEWFAGPAKKTTLAEAKSWASELSVNGGDWRLPTSSEVSTLSREAFQLLKIQGWSVLSSPTYPGGPIMGYQIGLSGGRHGERWVAVRSSK
jgi:hypothetical protein